MPRGAETPLNFKRDKMKIVTDLDAYRVVMKAKQSEIDGLREALDKFFNILFEQEKEIERLRKALEFYAQSKNI